MTDTEICKECGRVKHLTPMPVNIQAERAVLAALLLDSSNIKRISKELNSDHFELESHSILYRYILDFYETGKALDILTLQNFLEEQGVLEKVGGIEYLIELQTDIPSFGMIKSHVDIIVNHFERSKE